MSDGGQLSVADTDNDGRVDVHEVHALMDRLHSMPEAVTATARIIFDAIDENRDGRISRTEHRRLVETWYGRSVDTDAVFDLLDLDGDGYLSRPEFALLWSQFWMSDDPAEPGNLLCGRIPESGRRAGGRDPATRPADGLPVLRGRVDRSSAARDDAPGRRSGQRGSGAETASEFPGPVRYGAARGRSRSPSAESGTRSGPNAPRSTSRNRSALCRNR
ncbi:EF-hand domain-containing protein [Embleya sp. NPDC008237]|uniref:EF-hand domain-containing protein n=1 Tax=Embleya sp. NPDC008237 TaxID=3363978 RepID=UPI0036EE5BD2